MTNSILQFQARSKRQVGQFISSLKVGFFSLALLSAEASSAKDCYGVIGFEEILPGNVPGATAATWNLDDVLHIDHIPGAVYSFYFDIGYCFYLPFIRVTRNSTELLYEADGNTTIYFEEPGHYEAVIYGGWLINEPILSIVIGEVPIVAISPYFILSGAWDPVVGLMRDDLRTLGYLPNWGMTFEWSTEPWMARAMDATVLSVGGVDAVVDWVSIELRDGLTAEILNKRSGLLKRSGEVTGMDGISPIAFPAPPGAYHIAIRHRNHLGAMTTIPIPLTEETAILDLREDQLELFGIEAMMPLGPFRGLRPGNARASYPAERVNYVGAWNDRDAILQRIGGTIPTAIVSGYFKEDVNLDGEVKYAGANNDRDLILQSIGGSIPTAVVYEQLP